MIPPRRGQSGFSLVELMIAVALLSIIGGIAVPSYLGAIQRAREAACIGYMRLWPQGQIQFYSRHGRFANNDEILVLDKYIGVGMGSGYTHQGYNFEIHSIPGETESNMQLGWEGTGSPIVGGATKSYYFIDHTGVLRYELGRRARRTSTALGKN